ncbi:MAG: M20/M25/M40 family metallo-hydrolase [Gemmatimonadota bacterium]
MTSPATPDTAVDEADLFRLVRRLVDVPSVTGDEGPVGRLLVEELEARGFAPQTQTVEDGRRNVQVTDDGTRVVLCTHMDTVAPFIPSREDDAAIHGRGSCDAKGILATMIVAAQRLRARGRTDVGLLFLVGEETDSAGARAANGVAPSNEFLIVGEPTDGMLASGHKGMLAFEVEVAGRAAHSAYPHLGDSALHRLLDLLARIRAAPWGNDPVLGAATVNVGRIEGGVAMNVVAPSARATVAIRLVGPAAEARARLDELVAGDPALRVRIVSASDAVHCHTAEGFPTQPVAFGSDLFHLGRWGRPLLVGPGSIHVAHTDGEHVLKRDLVQAVSTYERLVERLVQA